MAALALLFSCEGNNVYYYTETTRSQAFGIKVSDPVEIKAKDDSTAFAKAYERFRLNVMAFNGVVQQNPDLTIVPLPIDFKLVDKAGIPIYFDSIIKQYDAVQDELSGIPDNNKAYAGAEFGMSMKEVLAIDHFKSLKMTKSADCLTAWDKVGNEDYILNLLFYKGELYKVYFESGPDYTSVYDFVKDKIVNIRDVFTKAYGTPSYSYGVPGENDRPYGSSLDLYRWSSKNKSIYISYARSNRGKHRMWAGIMDKNRNEAKQKEKEEQEKKAKNEKNARINEAASAF